MTILVTGGAGYIGSHTAVELMAQKDDILILDNFCNSKQEVILKLKELGHDDVKFIEGDVTDKTTLRMIFSQYNITSVMHFAGLKSVNESISKPGNYYWNNVLGVLALLEIMEEFECYTFIFSSSATVYGFQKDLPISESANINAAMNPYGRSKQIAEQILQDFAKTNESWSIALLRYFNPTGAHESGLIGEEPIGIPNNLVPYICQVASKKRDFLYVYGDDYETHDGTGVRDYIHVVDLAKGHIAALNYLRENSGCHIWNLGTGHGYSVLDVINTFQNITGVEIPYIIAERRDGDVAKCWANPSKANHELGWAAKKNLQEMMRDVWRWQEKN